MWKAFEVGRRIESVMVPLELMQQLRLFTQLWISLLIPGRIMSLCRFFVVVSCLFSCLRVVSGSTSTLSEEYCI
ncbi:hypothetical protein P8452_03460 [Trifolium repens]|nr:hypothetical protein P8452_03460 [Trifolium repens]